MSFDSSPAIDDDIDDMSFRSSLIIDDNINEISLYTELLYGIWIYYSIMDYILAFILAYALSISSMPFIYQPY